MVDVKPAVKLTYEDYLKTPDDERWELLSGELIMAPSPTRVHQQVALELASRLLNFVTERDLGQVFIAPFDVVLSDTTVVQPDVLFVSTEQAHIILSENVRGAPELVVEILSPSTASRDWRDKLDLYAEHGVNEYWIVDPDARRVWVMKLEVSGFEEAGTYGEDGTLTSHTLEDFTLNLADVFGSQVRSEESKS